MAKEPKTISPYNITILDNLGLLIMQVQLMGEIYDEWARSLRTALRVRKKFGLLMGQPRSLWMSQRILKNGGPLISYWCPRFETPLNHICSQRSHMSR